MSIAAVVLVVVKSIHVGETYEEPVIHVLESVVVDVSDGSSVVVFVKDSTCGVKLVPDIVVDGSSVVDVDGITYGVSLLIVAVGGVEDGSFTVVSDGSGAVVVVESST